MDTGNVIGRNVAAAAVLAAVWIAPAGAGDRNGEFAVFSVGADTCGDYLRARRLGGTAFDAYGQWLLGYLSAFNLIVADTYDIMGGQSYRRAVRWLDGYCAGRTDTAFIDAAAALTVSWYPHRRVRAPDTPVEPWNTDGVLQSAGAAPQR